MSVQNPDDEDDEQEQADRHRGSSVAEGDQLRFESEIPHIGALFPYDAVQIAVDGTEIPGAYRYRHSGDGYESQYLNELQSGGEGGGLPYDADEDLSGSGGDEGDSSDEEPPEVINIEAYCGHSLMSQLRNLRLRDETFTATVGGETFDEMELSGLEIVGAAEEPYAYSVEIEIQEWREVETDVGGDSDTDYGQGSDGENEVEYNDLPQSGTEDDPNQISVEEDETLQVSLDEGDRLRYVDIDATAPGADVQVAASGNDWEISNVSIEGGDDQTPAITTDTVENGDGTIRDVVIDGQNIGGEGDDSPGRQPGEPY